MKDAILETVGLTAALIVAGAITFAITFAAISVGLNALGLTTTHVAHEMRIP